MRHLLPLLRRDYSYLAKDFIGPMLELFSVGRATCGGDLDRLFIVLVVAMRTAEDRRVLDLDLDDVLRGAVDVYPSLSTNVRSISDSTGIPKESVRRKVAALVEEGWIHRQGNSLSLAPQASRWLTPCREQLFQIALRYHQLIQDVDAQQR